MTSLDEQFADAIGWVGASGFRALYRKATQEICKHGHTFQPDEIGELAWGWLTLDGQPEALRELFFAFWRDDERMRDEWDLQHAALDAKRSYLSDETLDQLGMCVAGTSGPRSEYVEEVELGWITDIVDEVKLLRRRIDMMRKLLISTERIENVTVEEG